MKRNLFHPVSDAILNAIRESSEIAVISHVNPDGDAIFSSLAMESILSQLGKKVHLLNDGPFKRREIMDYESRFTSIVSDKLKNSSPLVMILDCSTEDRPGEVYQSLKGNKTIVIDHHASGRPFYEEKLSYISPLSPSTTLLVDEVRKALSVSLDRNTAEYLMLGFLTDTGFFHFISERTAPECLVRVAAFTAAGVSPYEVYDEMHDGRKLQDIKDTASIILAAVPELDGRVITAYQGVEMKNARLSDGVYASLLEAEHVLAVIFIKDKGDYLEIGFRSKNGSGIDVGSIAASIGGGGHARAAGATISGCTPEQARQMLLGKLSEAIGVTSV